MCADVGRIGAKDPKLIQFPLGFEHGLLGVTKHMFSLPSQVYTFHFCRHPTIVEAATAIDVSSLKVRLKLIIINSISICYMRVGNGTHNSF